MLNAGIEPSVIINHLLERRKNFKFGFDVTKAKYCNMIKQGIVDPMKVVRSALQNAVSIASLMITTECLIVNRKNIEGNPAMPGM
jgi:chaperonin GroEL